MRVSYLYTRAGRMWGGPVLHRAPFIVVSDKLVSDGTIYGVQNLVVGSFRHFQTPVRIMGGLAIPGFRAFLAGSPLACGSRLVWVSPDSGDPLMVSLDGCGAVLSTVGGLCPPGSSNVPTLVWRGGGGNPHLRCPLIPPCALGSGAEPLAEGR